MEETKDSFLSEKTWPSHSGIDTSVSNKEANEIAKQVSNIGDIALFLLTPQKGLPKLVKNPTGTLKKVTDTAQKVKNTKAFKELKFVQDAKDGVEAIQKSSEVANYVNQSKQNQRKDRKRR